MHSPSGRKELGFVSSTMVYASSNVFMYIIYTYMINIYKHRINNADNIMIYSSLFIFKEK